MMRQTVHYRLGAGRDAREVESRCGFCLVAAQYGLNFALLLDFALNTVLGGSPNETLSQRTARARRAGSVGARRFCAVLTWVWKHVFRSKTADHCSWALEDGSIGREIWSWSNDPPNAPPPPDAR